MKLRLAVLPLIVIASFVYSGSVLDRVSDHGTKKITLSAVKKTVNSDLSKFHPSDVFVYNN